MKRFEDLIRGYREEKDLPLRTVAAYLDIDQAILSKIERGIKRASREQVILLAKYFKVNEKELLIAWLSGKVVDELIDESLGLEALQVAEEQMKYGAKKKS